MCECAMTTTSASFEYLAAASVTSLSPMMGAISGGTAVQVTGTGFRNSTTLQCRFGSATVAFFVAATYVSPTKVECTSPAAAATGGDGSTVQSMCWTPVSSGSSCRIGRRLVTRTRMFR